MRLNHLLPLLILSQSLAFADLSTENKDELCRVFHRTFAVENKVADSFPNKLLFTEGAHKSGLKILSMECVVDANFTEHFEDISKRLEDIKAGGEVTSALLAKKAAIAAAKRLIK